MQTFEVRGSYGRLIVEAASGLIIDRPERVSDFMVQHGACWRVLDASEAGTADECVSAFGNASCPYDDIARFDPAEWSEFHGRPITGEGLDILDIGFWTRDGEHIAAEEDWRARSASGEEL